MPHSGGKAACIYPTFASAAVRNDGYWLEAWARRVGCGLKLATVRAICCEQRSLGRFHGRHGFVQAGRFPKVGRKWGKDFDLIWLQKML